MLAVITPKKILLLVPRVTEGGIKIEGYRHLFELDEDKLKKVFASTIETLQYIKRELPTYQPHIEWHVGKAGFQTVGLLHTRFQNLPKSFIGSKSQLANFTKLQGEEQIIALD